MSKFGVRLRAGLIVALCSLSGASCSPTMLFDRGRDEAVEQAPGYRPVNQACSSLKLGINEIYVPQFRQLLRCLNAYGGIGAIEKLTDRLSDAELQPAIDVVNRHLLKNPARVRELDRTLERLRSTGQLDPLLRDAGRLFDNGELVSATVALLRNAYRSPDPREQDRLLRALERLSTRMEPQNLERYLDAGLTVASAPAFGSLTDRFAGPSAHGRELRDLVERVHRFAQDSPDPGRFDALRETLQAFSTSRERNLFAVLDESLGTRSNEFRRLVPRAASALKATMRTEMRGGRASDAPLLDDISSLVHYLNGPLYCLQGTRRVPNAMLWVMREIVQDPDVDPKKFIQRKQLLTAMAMNPFCRYPDALGEYYPAMFRLADTEAIEPVADLLKAFTRQGLETWIVRLLADTGARYPGGPPENTARLKWLLPVVAELTDREIWEDLLLLAALPPVDRRGAIIDEIRFLMEPADSLGGESLYDVLARAATRASIDDLVRVASALRANLGPEAAPILAPALRSMRGAFHANDAYPLSGFTRDVLAEATRNREFFSLLFRLSELEEFGEAVRLLSAMSGDGRLRDLLITANTLIAGLGREGPRRIVDTTEPPFAPAARHEFSAASLRLIDPRERPNPADPCRRLDPRVPMSDYLHSRFDEQLATFTDCVAFDGRHDDVRTAVEFLRRERTSEGRDFFEHAIDMVKKLELSVPQLEDLSGRVIRYYDEAKLFRLMDAIPLFVSRKVVAPEATAGEGPVLRPLLDVLRPIVRDAGDELRRLLDRGATIVERDDVPSVLRYAERLWDRPAEAPGAPALPDGFDRERIAREVRNRECRLDPVAREAAVDRVVEDYRHSINNWELVEGRGRRRWERHEWLAAVTPLFQKFGDSSQNRADKHAIDGLLGVLRLFTREAGQAPDAIRRYRPDELVEFLHPRANDWRAILYFHPGDREPKVKLASTLDRLELVVINADVEVPLPDRLQGLLRKLGLDPGNLGMRFLAMLAEAYGDEPFESWPDELRRRYPRGRAKCGAGAGLCPRTLHEAYVEMTKTARLLARVAGFPELPDCAPAAQPPYRPGDPEDARYTTEIPKFDPSGLPDWVIPPALQANIFNIWQLLPSIRENLPLPHGEAARAGGLRVIRDLLWELYSSSPGRNRRAQALHKNNLKTATILSRLGFLRQTGRAIRGLPADDPAMRDFFRGLVEAAPVPELSAFFRTLFLADRENRLAWKTLDTLYGLNESAEDTAWLKQFALYTVAASHRERLGMGPSRWFARNALATIDAAVREHYDWLTAKSDAIADLLRERRIPQLVRALYEDDQIDRRRVFAGFLTDLLADPRDGEDLLSALRAADEDPDASRAWTAFRGRFDAVRELDAYRQLRLSEAARDLLHFFQEEGAPDTPRAMRAHLARLLTAPRAGRSDVDEVLRLMAEKPDGFYQVLETVARATENEELKDFVRLARRALSEDRAQRVD